MAFIPFTDTVQAVLEYGNGTFNWTNTLWFTRPNFTLAEQQSFADWLGLWAVNNILPSMASIWSGQVLTVYDMASPTAPKVFSTQFSVAGGQVAAEGAINAALVVTFYTAARGRSGRGRNYLTGFTENDMTAVQVNDAVIVTNLQQAYETLRTTAPGQGWEWVIAQRQEAGQPLTQGVTRPVTSVLVRSDYFGSQRRRVPRP